MHATIHLHATYKITALKTFDESTRSLICILKAFFRHPLSLYSNAHKRHTLLNT